MAGYLELLRNIDLEFLLIKNWSKIEQKNYAISPGSICRDESAILKINLAPVFLSKILRSISSKNSAYQA
jgi:hypothetical protein